MVINSKGRGMTLFLGCYFDLISTVLRWWPAQSVRWQLFNFERSDTYQRLRDVSRSTFDFTHQLNVLES